MVAVIALWQAESPALNSDMVKFTLVVGIAVLVISVTMFYVFRALRPKTDNKVTDQIRGEFEKSKEALLLAAQQKRAGKESDDSARREAERETRERELLKENVDPRRVVGLSCPLCTLEMMDDQELVIDPYTGQGYHFSCYLQDWPAEGERPKHIYRYPQGTVLRSDDLIRSF
jgi:hypothetical protein